MGEPALNLITPRWEPLLYHKKQHGLYVDNYRFPVVPSGRRSGKTELAKRKTVRCALIGTRYQRARFFLAAPVYRQAKKIFWQDVLDMIPDWGFYPNKARAISHSELVVRLGPGSEIHVLGMDKPERIEGPPWDGGVLDEYANMRPETWQANVRPALADRRGWCWFIGVPEGRNHYYDLYRKAKVKKGKGGWKVYHWFSADILPPDEVAAAREDLDELTYQQEMEGAFVTFQGNAYYAFDYNSNCHPLEYDPRGDLIVCLDFNRAPGVAAIAQEQIMPDQYVETFRNGVFYDEEVYGTGFIGEVFIPRNSNTKRVCEKLAQDWGAHLGRVFIYGDATGGSEGSAKTEGSDWDIVKSQMHNYQTQGYFTGGIYFKVKASNPTERARINAVNSRCRSASGVVRLMVDPDGCPNLVRDFEGTRLLEGGAGVIDKKHNPELTHLTDGVGYYIEYEYPTKDTQDEIRQLII